MNPQPGWEDGVLQGGWLQASSPDQVMKPLLASVPHFKKEIIQPTS